MPSAAATFCSVFRLCCGLDEHRGAIGSLGACEQVGTVLMVIWLAIVLALMTAEGALPRKRWVYTSSDGVDGHQSESQKIESAKHSFPMPRGAWPTNDGQTAGIAALLSTAGWSLWRGARTSEQRASTTEWSAHQPPDCDLAISLITSSKHPVDAAYCESARPACPRVQVTLSGHYSVTLLRSS